MAFMEREHIAECLKDAGCSNDEILDMTDRFNTGDMQAFLRMLTAHRKSVLDTLHENEKRLSCLDYLIFQTEKEYHQKSGKRCGK